MKELLKFNQHQNIIDGIVNLVNNHSIGYLDACIMYAEENNLEIEVVAECIKKSEMIKGNLEIEGEALHFLKKINRLPL